MAKKIKILFLAVNPVNTSHLRLDKEVSRIDEKLRVGTQRDRFKLISEWAVTPGRLQELFLRHKPHIVHFSGHGSKTEGISLEDDSGNAFFLDQKAFVELLEIIRGVRIVVLNACYSKDQADALKKTIDFSIGMNTSIGDEAAIVFAAYFYQALAFGESVQDAFRLATLQLDILKIPESSTPELIVRYGVNPNESPLSKESETPKKQVKKARHSHEPESGGMNLEGKIVNKGKSPNKRKQTGQIVNMRKA